MKVDQLREEIAIEVEALHATVKELLALQADAEGRELTVREVTAAASFLAQFYGAIESILIRISRFHGVSPPTGDTWHVDLFRRFCTPSQKPLPALLDDGLAADLAPFRRFRHVVYHSYSFQFDWSRMSEGVAKVETILLRFIERLSDYLQALQPK